LEELKQTVKLLGNVIGSKELNTDEATGLLKVVTDYAYALDVLDRYDHQVLEIEATSPVRMVSGENGILYRPDGSKKIADNALVALTLMIAESRPEEKEMMAKVVVNLINLKN
jgi:hypothetical protein